MSTHVSPAIDDAELHRRQRVSQRAFHRGLARYSPGAQTLAEASGLQATIIPAAAHVALLNAVLYDDPAVLLESLERLAGAYAEAGVDGFAVWVPGEDRATARALRDAGHRRGGVLTISAGLLAELDLEPRMELDLVADPTAEMVGWCNDQAYGLDAPRSMVPALKTLDEDPQMHAYAARQDGELVCAGLFRHDGENVYVYGLAVVPGAQGGGIGLEVLRLSHREGLAAGCTTVTSDVSRGGFEIGVKMGKHSIGQRHIWVRSGLTGNAA